MPAHASESLILRTYPLRESDLIVSFLTRDAGKLRGVARAARRPKSRFGSGLERLSHSRMFYILRENRDLLTLTGSEIIHSPFAIASNYETGVALDYLAEVSDLLLPPNEVNEKFFRLLVAVLEYLRGEGSPWCGVLYFSLWAVRLTGIFGEPSVSEESKQIALEMFLTPIGRLQPQEWSKATARDLRRWLLRDIESHVERRVQSAVIMEAL